MKSTIAGVHARRVWDSRGRPTVEAEVALAGGARGRAIAPAGMSRGSRDRFTRPSLSSRRIATVVVGVRTRSREANSVIRIGPLSRSVNRIDTCAMVRSGRELLLVSPRRMTVTSLASTRCRSLAKSLTCARVSDMVCESNGRMCTRRVGIRGLGTGTSADVRCSPR